MPMARTDYKNKYSNTQQYKNQQRTVVPQNQGLPSNMTNNVEDDYQEIQEVSQTQIIQSVQQEMLDNEVLDVEDVKVEGSEFIQPATEDQVRQFLYENNSNLQNAKILPKQAPIIVQAQPQQPIQQVAQQQPQQSMAAQVNQSAMPQDIQQIPNAQQSYAQQVNQSQFVPQYHPSGMVPHGNPAYMQPPMAGGPNQMYAGPAYNPYMGGNMQNPIGVRKELASEVKAKALELVPGYDDPNEPLYIINMSDQAITFTKLFGTPKRDENPENYSPTIGTVDDRDPNATVEPFMIIQPDKKEKAMANYFFSKYLLEGVIKAITEDEFRLFQNNYYNMMDQSRMQRSMMEAMAQSGMMEIGGLSPQQQMMQQNYYYYQQQRLQNYGGFQGENVNPLSNLVNPNEFYQQQAIGEWFGANPEGSWSSLLF